MLPPERPGRPAPPDTAAVREAIAGALRSGVWTTDPLAEERTIGGVRCLVFNTDPDAARGTVLHFHGGAFRIGVPEQMGPFASTLSRRCGVRVVCPAYRLAPEHPFPAGLNDAHAVLAALAAEAGPPILLSGDSAGGGLAASLALLAHDGALPVIGLILLSPWLDLRLGASSYASNATTDPLFSAQAAVTAAELYLQGHDPSAPLASPLLGEPRAFPPTLVNVGSGEVLLDDARGLADRLTAVGTTVLLDVVPDMEHVAVTRSLSLTGAAHCLERVVAFVEDRFRR